MLYNKEQRNKYICSRYCDGRGVIVELFYIYNENSNNN